MGVLIGSARGDENGGATGGKAGDQTGMEVSTQNWYQHQKGWRVFRAKDPVARTKIASDMQAACLNSHIGYDQYQRDTLYNAAEAVNFDCAKVDKDVETDCSALVRVCCVYAGIMLPNFNTQTEPSVLLNSGAFTELTGSKYTDSSAYLEVGDILVTRTKGHTVIVLTNGSKAGGQINIQRGDNGEDVRQLQIKLLAHGYSVGPDGADGDFGKNTEAAVKAFQRNNNLVPDGIVGPATWAALNAPPKKYTVTIYHLDKAEADAMQSRWPDCEVVEE